jgi:hypothetical protein
LDSALRALGLGGAIEACARPPQRRGGDAAGAGDRPLITHRPFHRDVAAPWVGPKGGQTCSRSTPDDEDEDDDGEDHDDEADGDEHAAADAGAGRDEDRS